MRLSSWNKLLMKNGVGTDYATKVVPIVSVGTGKYIGAVQVIGPSAQVEKVKAVAQLEGEFNGIARANALIPMATTNVSPASPTTTNRCSTALPRAIQR